MMLSRKFVGRPLVSWSGWLAAAGAGAGIWRYMALAVYAAGGGVTRFGFGGGFGGFACAGRVRAMYRSRSARAMAEAARWCERLTITRSEFRQPSSVAASAQPRVRSCHCRTVRARFARLTASPSAPSSSAAASSSSPSVSACCTCRIAAAAATTFGTSARTA